VIQLHPLIQLPREPPILPEAAVNLTYDIFRKLPDGVPIWVEAVQTLELAHVRLDRLSKSQPGDYVVYDLTRRQVIAEAISRAY
jgi:hypothetical protein